MTPQKVTVDITTSLDGFIAGPNDGPGNGLGDEGERLHQWVYELESWRGPHGLEGGERNRDSEVLEETFEASGAVVVGRRMFENAEGWGDEPPFKVPVFVVTHESLDDLTKGATTFHFVDGVENAIERAREAAGDKNVSIGGGASIIQQALRAGLLDEIQIHIAPLFLRAGVPLFDDIDPQTKVEAIRVIESPVVTHIKYKIG